jgi:cytochrome P450
VARKLCHEILDANWDKGEIDVVGDFAGDLSVSMACLAIGLPVEDGPMLSGLVQGFFRHEPDTGGMTKEGLASLESLKEYCGDAVRARRRRGSKSADALGAIATHEMGGRELSEEAAASHLSMLVIGGSETFPKVLANGVRRLWEHPDQRAMLASEPARIPDAFDEILRFDMPTQLLGRTLRKDVSIHGRSLREGQAVFFLFAAANRDEREFPNPDAFDTQRRPKRILSFGAGTHQCLGTHVARMEGRVALGVLLERMPSYEVDLSGAGRHETEFVQGFSRLSLRFET